MDTRVAVGIGAGIAGLGAAAGLHLAMRAGRDRQDERVRAEWDAWSTELDRAFPRETDGPGESKRPLPDAAAHQRFDEFLTAHPAPGWVDVDHDGMQQASIHVQESPGFDAISFGAGMLGLGGGIGMGMAGGLLLERAGAAGSTLGTGLNVAGAALGLASLAGLFLLPKDQASGEINRREWDAPRSWRD
jgi:hypothetical protein